MFLWVPTRLFILLRVGNSGNTRPTRLASCEKRSQSQTETQNAIGNTFRQYCLPKIAKCKPPFKRGLPVQ
ncbi:hypothetical protein E2C01_019764 [Portunus trituberculatus]|uniref:Secreted protein n=1 Tax=Portunus trituberculatus TaxID=210409 RepID=A0A5B7DZR9_PORTR|nr:hypothetical protein [Portunus trituberculatus]